jgi:hypothetical protein
MPQIAFRAQVLADSGCLVHEHVQGMCRRKVLSGDGKHFVRVLRTGQVFILAERHVRTCMQVLRTSAV